MARSPKCKLADVWDSRASQNVRDLMRSMPYLALDDPVIQECWTELFNTEIEILAKNDQNWKIFEEYVLKTYVLFDAKISPLGEI